MAHKTLTISEEAYNSLARLKQRNESFTDVIMRLTRAKDGKSLIDYVKTMKPDNEFATLLDKILEKRTRIRLRIGK